MELSYFVQLIESSLSQNQSGEVLQFHRHKYLILQLFFAKDMKMSKKEEAKKYNADCENFS